MTEWDQRQLCPDGACVGVIGPDGLCKVCGHAAPNWGDERTRGLQTDADEDEDLDDDEDEIEDEDDEIQPGTPVEIGEWKERALCSDGACIGVIGDDDKCRVCGKSPA
jgi:hypothetical protein